MLVLSMHTSPLSDPGEGDAGGMNVYVRQLSRAMVDQGARVHVVTRSDTGSAWEARDDGVTVAGLPVGPPDAAKEDLPALVPDFARAVHEHLAAHRIEPDVVHSHYWLSGMVALALPARAATWAHTMHTLGATKNAELAGAAGSEPAERLAGERRILASVDLAVASTTLECRQLREQGAPPEHCRVIPPGVDDQTFHPLEDAERRAVRAEVRRQLGLPDDALLLVQAGRWQAAKGQLVLLEAVEHLWAAGTRAHAVFVGGPSGAGDARELPARIEQSPAREGLVPHEAVAPAELARFLHAADLVVVPSRTESFGLVAVEAMACGTPVVAARVGGLPDAVGDAGVLVDGHDPRTWAEQIGRLLADPAARRALGEAGRRRAATMSWQDTARAHLAAYREET